MFHRQPVAWVLAETLEAAQRGAERVRVEYEPLTAILSIQQAIDAGSYLTEPLSLSRGDVSAIDASALTVDGELFIGGQEHFYLETQAAIAWIDETGGISVHASTQHPSETQDVIGRVLGLARNQVTVECLRMGGAFGGKEVQANPWAAIAALGAWKTRRPVRVRLTRELDMALTGKRHPYLARYSAGFSMDGHIEAVRFAFFADGGLEPRPVGTDHVALAVSLRQRVLPSGGRGHRPCVPDPQDIPDRVSWLRGTTGDGRD